MSRQIRTLLILAVAAVLLFGGYFLLRSRETGSAEDMQETPLYEVESLARIDVTRGGETLRFEKGAGGWTYPADPLFPLNAAYLRDMENQLKRMTALHVFSEENPDFGLEEPDCLIRALTPDGQEIRCALGAINDTSNIVYARVDDRLCALDDGFARCFRHSLNEMARKDLVPRLQAFQTTAVHLENENGSIAIRQEDAWQLPEGQKADEERVRAILAAVSGTVLGELAVCHPTDGDLGYYGLSEPSCSVFIENTEGDFRIATGHCERDGGRYAYLPQWDSVYAVEAWDASLDGLREEELRDRTLFSVEYKELTRITFQAAGETEKEITDPDARWELYYMLKNMRAESFAERPAETEYKLTLETGGGPITLSWGAYDENFACVSLDDGRNMLVNRREMGAVATLLAGSNGQE